MSHIWSSWHDFYGWADSSNVASLLFPATFIGGYVRYEHHRSRKHLTTLHDELKRHAEELHNVHLECLQRIIDGGDREPDPDPPAPGGHDDAAAG